MESQNQHPPQPQEPSELGTTFFRICVIGLNTLSGVGILSIPFALFHEVGNSTSAVRRTNLCLPPTFIPARLKAHIWEQLVQIIPF
ncbi:vacuolar amino acid transporter 1 [Prunus yedoensis var. nudiflora]|uniref:Vacuolar amino acid transporter 1 n=1 Tax=Prunus yedoensis var. nudiflora TaxID=2094558 RepID=A0A314ZD78_PRUYE|nr:vacuolar amino acid transporter 1 [Prunus yedoensis var. nudiflora]